MISCPKANAKVFTARFLRGFKNYTKIVESTRTEYKLFYLSSGRSVNETALLYKGKVHCLAQPLYKSLGI